MASISKSVHSQESEHPILFHQQSLEKFPCVSHLRNVFNGEFEECFKGLEANSILDRKSVIKSRIIALIESVFKKIFPILKSYKPRHYYTQIKLSVYPLLGCTNNVNEISADSLVPIAFIGRCRRMLDKIDNYGGHDLDLNPILRTYANIIIWQLLHELLCFSERFIEAEMILVDWWNTNTVIQLNSEKHIYRAKAAHKLAKFQYGRNLFSSAARWFLLAHIDDCLNYYYPFDKSLGTGAYDGYSAIEAGAGYALRTFFQFTEVDNEQLMHLIEEAVIDNYKDKVIDKEFFLVDNKFWAGHKGFPEYYFTEYISTSPFPKTHLFQPTTRTDHPLNPYYVAVFHRYLQDIESKSSKASKASPDADFQHKSAVTLHEKGIGFEKLAAYLFSTIDGFLPEHDIRSEDQAFQNDIVVYNMNPSNVSLQHLFGNKILVECKNRITKVSSSEAGYFIARMLALGCKFGVFFSREGVTKGISSLDARFAMALTRRFRPQINVAVIEDLDIKNLYADAQSNKSGDSKFEFRAVGKQSPSFLKLLLEAYDESADGLRKKSKKQ